MPSPRPAHLHPPVALEQLDALPDEEDLLGEGVADVARHLARFQAVSLAFALAYFSLLLTDQDALLSFSFLLWYNEELTVGVIEMALEQPGQQLPIEHLMTNSEHLFKCLPSPLDPSARGSVDKIE